MSQNNRRDGQSSGSKSRGKKAPRLTCVNCRNRKIRCDGGQPNCGICVAYGETCEFDKPPPMTQVIAMTEKIKELEKTIQNLQKSRSSGQTQTVDTRTSARPVSTEPMPSSSNPGIADVDLDRSDAYYDTTSAIHAPRGAETPRTSTFEPTQHTPRMILSPQDMMMWEENAIANCAILLQLAPDKIRHLLATHWTWVHPTFMFVNREMFLRDAAVGGEYFSPFLLTVICLHSTRFTDYELTERLLVHAKMLLSQEIHTEPSIAKVQALLQFSAREIGRGATSLAWLYGGMAFRTALDLGLLGRKVYETSDAEEKRKQELGQQLAWSCFLWDKAISLYLGRTPTLANPPERLPETWTDTTSGQDTWAPYGTGGSAVIQKTSPSHVHTCFSNFCKLGVIVNNILLHIYGHDRTQEASSFVKEHRQKLESWFDALPAELKLDNTSMFCPSPHVVTQNLLYRASTILLLRPFRRSQACRSACREAADIIECLFLSLERTFGLTRVTYLMAYCAYIAATVAVQDTKDGIMGSQRKVDTYLRALSAVRSSCPGIQRSMDVIAQCLQHAPQNAPSSVQTSENDLFFLDQMPTFPYNNQQTLDTMVITDPLSLPFADLDSYTVQWSNFSDDSFDTFAI